MSKMLEAIKALHKTVTEFHLYLHLTKDHTKSWQREPIETMILNAVSTTRKLNKLSLYVIRHQNNPEMENLLAEKVYSKLIEYIARLQEAITGCMLREKNNNNLPYCEFLMDLTMRVDQILLKPNNFYFTLPKKHWLTIEQTALNIADNIQEYEHPRNNKTVLFRALKSLNYNVTSTTQQKELIDKVTKIELDKKVSAKL